MSNTTRTLIASALTLGLALSSLPHSPRTLRKEPADHQRTSGYPRGSP